MLLVPRDELMAVRLDIIHRIVARVMDSAVSEVMGVVLHGGGLVRLPSAVVPA